MKNLPEKDLLRPDEVAEYLSYSVKTIYGWIAEGKLDAVRVGPYRALRVKRITIKKMIHPTS